MTKTVNFTKWCSFTPWKGRYKDTLTCFSQWPMKINNYAVTLTYLEISSMT